MGKVIKFPIKERVPPQLLQLKSISDQLDQVIVTAINEGADPYEVAGLLAHRLGNLIKPMDAKDQLWDVCERVLKREAVLEK